jgi:hypothetical protein
VVDSHDVQDRRLQVVHVDRVLGDVVAEVVGRAVGEARLDAAARHPAGEAARVMIAAVVGRGELALRVVRAPELAAPDDQRVVEQAALFQVGDQRVAGAVDVGALAAMPSGSLPWWSQPG